MCVMAPPIHLGAWSKATLLWLPIITHTGPAGLLFQETEEYVALVTLTGTHTHHVVHSLWEDDTNTIQ